MSLQKQEKENIIEKYKTSENDTGSPQVQIALISAKITKLAEHLKTHKKDKHSRRGLVTLVGQRRKLFKYVEKKEGKDSVIKLQKNLGLVA